MIVFYYIINGARCFFSEPAPPHITQAQPMQAIVEFCKEAKQPRFRCTGVGDSIPINGKDTVLWGILIDFQE